MKLIRLKFGESFRSLQAGFEFHFLEEGDSYSGLRPYVLAGPNGSGKSNILEALAAIFYHLETCTLRTRPEAFGYDEETNPDGFRQEVSTPDAFEIEYYDHHSQRDNITPGIDIHIPSHTRVCVTKKAGEQIKSCLVSEKPNENNTSLSNQELRKHLPDFVLGYSSGENEILSLPFFKTRFLHLDEYLECLRTDITYPNQPESRLTFLDQEFRPSYLAQQSSHAA